MTQIQRQKKILILSVSGIGNTILQSPTIDTLLTSGKYRIDILFGNQAMADVYADSNIIHEKIILSSYTGITGKIVLLWKLFRNRYTMSLALFPSHRREFHILPILACITHRYSHSYTWGRFTQGTFLSNHTIPADPALHDIDQNLNLLTFFSLEKPLQTQLHFAQSEKDRDYASEYIDINFQGSQGIIGIHPGSGDLTWKRWGDEKYTGLIAELVKRGFQIVLFGTGTELENFAPSQNVSIFRGTINEVGAMIARCRFFISGDTGLMHIAASQHVPQVVIWKGTMLSRTRPFSNKAIIVKIKSKKNYHYPFG